MALSRRVLLHLHSEPFCDICCCAGGVFDGLFAASWHSVDVEVGTDRHEDCSEDCTYFRLEFCSGGMLTSNQPYLAGVFAGTLFWIGARWVTKILPGKLTCLSASINILTIAASFFNHPFLNIFFFILYSLCGFFYIKAMTEDPGFVPKAGGRNGQKGVIDELLELRKFDEANFCVTCMVRRPLRSKHCKRCNRCVAKQDQ